MNLELPAAGPVCSFHRLYQQHLQGSSTDEIQDPDHLSGQRCLLQITEDTTYDIKLAITAASTRLGSISSRKISFYKRQFGTDFSRLIDKVTKKPICKQPSTEDYADFRPLKQNNFAVRTLIEHLICKRT